MNIYLATDHAGHAHKERLLEFFKNENNKGHLYSIIDCGAALYDENDDYTIYVHEAMLQMKADWMLGLGSRAIIFGGSGQGEAMVANRYQGVRATVYYGHDMEIVALGREHNDANVLSIGARFVGQTDMLEAVQSFLDTPFSNDTRHIRRISEIDIKSV